MDLRDPRAGFIAVAIATALAACGDTPTAFTPIEGDDCARMVTVTAEAAPAPSSIEDLQSALLHAAGPMASALGGETQVEELSRTTSALAESFGVVSHNTECRLVVEASELLVDLPDDPATRPDRAGIQLILSVVARALESP